MKIIISPAKIMKEEVGLDYKSTPTFLSNAKEIWAYLKTCDIPTLKKIWDCNDNLIKENKLRLDRYDLESNLMPALLVYDGLAFKKMAANVFDEKMWDYVNSHLCILSGLYGLLRPLDGINPYRLMMGAKININGCNSLYEYWKDMIYKEIIKDDKNILNLASKEYSDVISPYLTSDVKMVDVIFYSKNKKGQLVVKSTEAKSCRGAMVRYCALNNINDFSKIKDFHDFNYRFSQSLSSDKEFVFIKEE